MNKKPQIFYLYRSSKTGKFVSKNFYKKHPATTERVKIRRRAR